MFNFERTKDTPDTVVNIGGIKIGGGNFRIIAGPCAIESETMLNTVADAVLEAGTGILRGGAFKPRTSPYSFQGLREEGLTVLSNVKKRTGLLTVSEIMDASHLPLFKDVDVLQIGSRNMQNFELLKAVGRQDKSVLLKRSFSGTLEDFLMSAEYILAEGNPNVILCERGIRTFEPSLKNTLDLSAVPMLKNMTHLPVIVDPSHATGRSELVLPMALAATACGADGLMIEVHPSPEYALSDGKQAITTQEFAELVSAVDKIRPYSYSRR